MISKMSSGFTLKNIFYRLTQASILAAAGTCGFISYRMDHPVPKPKPPHSERKEAALKYKDCMPFKMHCGTLSPLNQFILRAETQDQIDPESGKVLK